ncbi:MAG: hypothetical protein P4L82_11055 [Ancalomicrobiaceae bacterium]|nr:hypothetical protein [Ancalomicrobiaceae bacterium]
MCSLCGVIGGAEHWSDAVARPGVYTRAGDSLSRRRERASRVRIANRILKHCGLRLSDWQGASFMLSTLTGRTELVEDLGHLWQAAERMAGRPIDPLSPEVIEAFERADE